MPDDHASPPPANSDRTLEFGFVLDTPRETNLLSTRRRSAAKQAARSEPRTASSPARDDAPAAPASGPASSSSASNPAPSMKPSSSSSRRAASAGSAPSSSPRPAPATDLSKEYIPMPNSSILPPRTSTMRAPTVDDFRRNAERQSQEQKAVGTLLSWVGYSLLGGLLFVAVLAGVGGYSLFRMIQQQSLTVAELNAHYEQEFDAIRGRAEADRLAFEAALTQANAQIDALKDLAVRQQDSIKALFTQSEKVAANVAAVQDDLKTEASRRYKGDKDNGAEIRSVENRVDALEKRVGR